MNKMIENYLLKESCGSGQYGKVYKALNTQTNAQVAVKVVKVDKFREVPKLNEFTNNEIKTLSKIENPNVIRFIEILQTQNNVYLVYEFCNGGTLEEVIQKKRFLSEHQSLHFFSQILHAFSSLVKENILHRDLKPSNILLNDGIIKVADFGFCKSLMGPQDLTKTMVGSPIYMAPEILKGQNYSIKADIWSMGVVLFEMLFGYCPYEDRTIAALITQINHKMLKIPKHIQPISQLTDMLLKYMLVVDPRQRIEWSQLLQIQGAITSFLKGKQQIEKPITNHKIEQKENKQAQQEQQPPLQKLQGMISQQKQNTEENNVLQPLLHQESKINDSNKQLNKQLSTNNLNQKAGRIQQQKFEKQHSLQTEFQQNSIQKFKEHNQEIEQQQHQQQQQNEQIINNLKLLMRQRERVLQIFAFMKDLMANSSLLSEAMVIVVFAQFRLIFKQLTDFRNSFQNSDQSLCSPEFNQFKNCFEKEEVEIIKCLELYFEQMHSSIYEAKKKTALIQQFLDFDFVGQKFTNQIAVGAVVNELKALLEKNNDNEVITNDQKALILAINRVIDYLLNDNQQDKINFRSDLDSGIFTNLPENQWNSALIQKILIHKQQFELAIFY